MACREIALDFSASFVPQPACTVAGNGLTTLEDFHLRPARKVLQEPGRHTHMNPAFGAIVLRDVLTKIRAKSADTRTGAPASNDEILSGDGG